MPKTRLADFASWTKTEAPKTAVDEDGAPSAELLAYCDEHGLSLDWLFRGDVKGLVLGLRHEPSSGPHINSGAET